MSYYHDLPQRCERCEVWRGDACFCPWEICEEAEEEYERWASPPPSPTPPTNESQPPAPPPTTEASREEPPKIFDGNVEVEMRLPAGRGLQGALRHHY
ncbi:hypothetical protein NQ318_022524 [Aromia moschata]|uniref:Uncharacterized protein n=1 Tax=Aromia moschata TaxID=1265417 RepID=A0AAV8XLX4_9CUCU|nr:hypothetical protein NQ318_022524 [Aromia moschata]